MTKIFTPLLCLVCILFFHITIKAQPTFMANEIIVSFDQGTPIQEIDDFFEDNDLIVLEGPLPTLNAYLAEVDPALGWPTGPTTNNNYNPLNGVVVGNTSSTINSLGNNYLTTPPDGKKNGENDGDYHDPLENCGSLSYNINVQSTGSSLINGAIFDTGLRYHSFFQGFVDPQNVGYSFVEGVNTPADDHTPGHGTHISSIITSGSPVGLTNNLDLYAYKTHDYAGDGTVWNIMKGIEKALGEEIHVINMSHSFLADYNHRFDDEAPLQAAIEIAKDLRGILFVVAGGNDETDIDNPNNYSNYPAAYLNDNTISVAAIDCNNGIANFSNWGSESIDVAAPGVEIWGLAANGDFIIMSGTSMACAFVTRVAQQLGTLQAIFDWEEVKCAIINGATDHQHLQGKVFSDGYLNAKDAEVIITGQLGCSLFFGDLGNSNQRSTDVDVSYELINDRINIQTTGDQAAQLNIFNALGQMLVSKSVQLNEGLSSFELPLKMSNQPAIYIVNLQYEGQNKTVKIIR